MKQLLLTLSIMSLLMLFSCSEEQLIDRREDRIEGTWEFHRVYFTGANALFRDEITHIYQEDEMTFYPDYSASYYDEGNQAVFEGDWFVNLEVFTDEDGAENVYFLDAFFYGDRTSEDFGYYGEIEFLTFEKLRMRVYAPEGEYLFRLRKKSF